MFNRLLPTLVVLLFLSLYSQPNIGGTGLWLPNNVVFWCYAFCVSLFVIWRGIYVGSLKLSSFTLNISVLMLTIVLLTGVNTSNHFIFTLYLLAVVTLIMFLVMLDQFTLEKKDFLGLLWALVVLGVVNGVISFVQIYDSYSVLFQLTGYLPFKSKGMPVGVFQQVNMLAVLLAVSFIASIYLLTTAKLNKSKVGILFLSFALMLILSVVLITESRAGLIGLVIGLFFLFYSRKRVLKRFHYLLFIIISAVLTSLLFYYAYLETGSIGVTSKLERVFTGQDVRLELYKVTFGIVINQPLYGFGAGGYSEALIKYLQLNIHNEDLLVQLKSFVHPHNEFLYWTVQGGVIVGLLLVLFFVSYFGYLYSYRKRQVFLIWGLTTPILFSALVSLPFVLVTLNLFLLLTLFYFGIRHRKLTIKFGCAVLCKSGITLGVTISIFASLYASYISLQSINDFYYFKNRLFLYNQPQFELFEKKGYFGYASSHPLYKEFVNEHMVEMLQRAYIANNMYDIRQYLKWVRATPNLIEDDLIRWQYYQAKEWLEQHNKGLK